MKLLSICDPAQYQSPPLDVPSFYDRLSTDSRIDFYHISTPQVFRKPLPQIGVVNSTGKLDYDRFLALNEANPQEINLQDIDLVFCRTLKPFPSGYLDRLTLWEKYTKFVNHPSSKKAQIKPEFLLNVAQNYMPEGIVTQKWTEALAFFEQFAMIVAKQANSCGGRGVFKIWYQHGVFYVDNYLAGARTFAQFSEVMNYLQDGQTAGIQFYRYLHRTVAGDKRIVVVDGEIYGGYLRRSKSGHWVNNVSHDGECILAEITSDEIAAIEHTVTHYQALGLHTLGYDFLLDDDGTWRISEINAGNIGGFARLELLTGQPVMNRLVDWLIQYSQSPLTIGN